jgi:hypothetical protein
LFVIEGTTVHADEAAAWDNLHERFEMKRINHGTIRRSGLFERKYNLCLTRMPRMAPIRFDRWMSVVGGRQDVLGQGHIDANDPKRTPGDRENRLAG